MHTTLIVKEFIKRTNHYRRLFPLLFVFLINILVLNTWYYPSHFTQIFLQNKLRNFFAHIPNYENEFSYNVKKIPQKFALPRLIVFKTHITNGFNIRYFNMKAILGVYKFLINFIKNCTARSLNGTYNKDTNTLYKCYRINNSEMCSTKLKWPKCNETTERTVHYNKFFLSPVIYLTLKWIYGCEWGVVCGDRSNKQIQNTITGHIVVQPEWCCT